MLPLNRLIFLAATLACVVLAGCSSSGTTGKEPAAVVSAPGGDTASAPLQQPQPQKQSRPQKARSNGKQQGFVTQEDTIEAQVVTRNHEPGSLKAPPKRTAKKKYYSVQLGAFRILANADHAQKLAKQRYKKPVYHFFDKAIKMYRVTIGNFSKIQDAFKFLKSVQHEHPKEYKDGWVAEMRR